MASKYFIYSNCTSTHVHVANFRMQHKWCLCVGLCLLKMQAWQHSPACCITLKGQFTSLSQALHTIATCRVSRVCTSNAALPQVDTPSGWGQQCRWFINAVAIDHVKFHLLTSRNPGKCGSWLLYIRSEKCTKPTQLCVLYAWSWCWLTCIVGLTSHSGWVAVDCCQCIMWAN